MNVNYLYTERLDTILLYGFNGAEKNEDIHQGFDYDLGARMYNSKLGRMFSPDPMEKKYAWQSTYVYYRNNPVMIIDFNGMGDEDDCDPVNDVAAIGGTLTLPATAEVTERYTEPTENAVKNSVKSFKYNDKTYTASFNGHGGFTGYRTGDGELYTGEDVFKELFIKVQDDYTPTTELYKWPIETSTETFDVTTEYKDDLKNTRVAQAAYTIGIIRLKQLFGIKGKASDAMSVAFAAGGVGDIKVKTRKIFKYKYVRHWYGSTAFNPITGTTYAVPTGTSSKVSKIRVGAATLEHQIYWKGKAIDGWNTFTVLTQIEMPMSYPPPQAED